MGQKNGSEKADYRYMLPSRWSMEKYNGYPTVKKYAAAGTVLAVFIGMGAAYLLNDRAIRDKEYNPVAETTLRIERLVDEGNYPQAQDICDRLCSEASRSGDTRVRAIYQNHLLPYSNFIHNPHKETPLPYKPIPISVSFHSNPKTQ